MYRLVVATRPTNSGIVGGDQDLDIAIEPVESLPELTGRKPSKKFLMGRTYDSAGLGPDGVKEVLAIVVQRETNSNVRVIFSNDLGIPIAP